MPETPGHDKSLWNLNPLLEKLLMLDLLQRTEHSRYVPSKQTRARSAAAGRPRRHLARITTVDDFNRLRHATETSVLENVSSITRRQTLPAPAQELPVPRSTTDQGRRAVIPVYDRLVICFYFGNLQTYSGFPAPRLASMTSDRAIPDQRSPRHM